MIQLNIFSMAKPKSYLMLIALAVIIVIAGRFVTKYALPYYGFTEDVMGRWWEYKWSLIGHISGGTIALLIGPLQFWKSLRSKYLTAHRWLGRIYLTAILIGVSSATYLAWTSGLRTNVNWALGLQGLALAWIVTASMAYISVRRKRIQQHKMWMIRSYVVTFAFVTFRFLSDLPSEQYFGQSISGSTFLWLSWSVPLLIAEIFLSWNKK